MLRIHKVLLQRGVERLRSRGEAVAFDQYVALYSGLFGVPNEQSEETLARRSEVKTVGLKDKV
jgi:hypothetical protein